jgi:hypothetical protein
MKTFDVLLSRLTEEQGLLRVKAKTEVEAAKYAIEHSWEADWEYIRDNESVESASEVEDAE